MNDEVRLLFRELADLSPNEREKALAERQIAPELRAEIISLLSFDSADDHHLTGYISVATEEALRAQDQAEPIKCGPYRLVRLLGSGGMGAVYLAERSDGEIQQQVAVKLLRSGEERAAWRDRFLKERQLLASLNHSAIARVIDAGHTADGRPYLVMEYVDGLPIDQYAAGKELRDQLALFLRVCEAVSHAHRHLIIHRDLKPSNILVDASGQPKLLDFGIAKLLDSTGDPTQTVERLLTPSYASPEQLRGTSQTTTTDVYSLGAVLYRLLTGRSPHETDTGVMQPIEVMAGTKKIASPSRLNPKLPSDLDYVLLKALRHEPEERYASVEAFANDIESFLESRPVQARSGNAWYRTRKWLRRYWVPVAAATVAIVALSAGLFVANRERVIAQRRFSEVRQLSNKLFDIDYEVRRVAGTNRVRQMIVDTSLEYLQRLAADAPDDPELALEVGNAYMRVARVQGVPISTNLGQMDQAELSLQKAEALLRGVVEAQPRNRIALLRSAQIAHDRMILAALRRPDDQAIVFARKSADFLDRFHSAGKMEDLDIHESNQVIQTHINVGRRFMTAEEFDQAIRLFDSALAIARTANPKPKHIGSVLEAVAEVRRRMGDLEEALQASRESVQLLEPSADTDDIGQTLNFVMALGREGGILGEDQGLSLGRPEEAIAPLERALQLTEEIAAKDPEPTVRTRLATVGIRLANILRHSKPSRANAIYDHLLRRLAEIKDNPKVRRDEVRVLAASTYSLRSLGREGEAQRRLDAAFARLSDLKLYPAQQIELGSEPHDALRALGDYQAATGHVAKAADIYKNLLDLAMASNPKPETSLTDALDLSNIYGAAAAVHRLGRQHALAVDLEARRLALWRHWDNRLPNNTFVQRQLAAITKP